MKVTRHAKKRIKDYESKSQDQFSEIVQGWKEGKFELEDAEYSEIRTCICSEYEKYKAKSGYEIDLRVGLALYKLFLEEKNKYKHSSFMNNPSFFYPYNF